MRKYISPASVITLLFLAGISLIYVISSKPHIISQVNNRSQLASTLEGTGSGLVGWWKFDEGSGTTAADSSGNDNNGTLSGNTLPTWTTGLVSNNALSFGGSGYVSRSSTDFGFNNGTKISLSAWINPESLTDGESILRKTTSGYVTNTFALYINRDGSVTFGFDNPNYGGSPLWTTSAGVVTVGNIYNITVTWDRSIGEAQIYVNGVNKSAVRAGYYDSKVYLQENSGFFTIGADTTDGASYSGYFNGGIDDVRIYNRALSVQEVSDLYTLGMGNTHSSDNMAPSVPTGLFASGVSPSQINLSWTSSIDNVGVTGYIIYRNGAMLTTTPSISYSDTGLTANTSYSYTVSATDAANNQSAQSSPVSATTQTSSVRTHTLSVTDSGNGTVTSDPAGISCLPAGQSGGSTCSDVFNEGTSVTLTASPSLGYVFTGWSGGICSGTGFCSVILSSDIAVTAIFSGQTVTGSCPAVSGKCWYVDSGVTTSGDGTSWSTAWSSLTKIYGVGAGDIVYVSGGPSGSFRLYTDVFNWHPSGGTSNAWVTYEVGQDSQHDGSVIFDGTDYNPANPDTYSAVTFGTAGGGGNFVILSGEVLLNGKSDGLRHIKFQNYQTSSVVANPNHTGMKLEYIDFGNYPVQFSETVDQIEISHCYFRSVAKDHAISFAGAHGSTWGVNSIHDNLIELGRSNVNGGEGDDGIQWGASTDIYDNVFRGVPVDNPGTQHQDGIQSGGQYLRIYGNYFENLANSSVYLDLFNVTEMRDILVYNNVFALTDPVMSIGYHRPIDVAYEVTADQPATVMDDIKIDNNTIVDYPDFNGISISSRAGTPVVTNSEVKNNIFYDVGKPGSFSPIYSQFPDVVVDNNLFGAGQSGSILAPTYYTDMKFWSGASGFVSYTPFSTNNDLHLRADDNVAKDGGLNLSSIFTTDKDGVSRPQGPAWDIGSYEYYDGQATTVPPPVAPPANGLLLHLDFSTGFSPAGSPSLLDYFPDVSGNGNDAYRYRVGTTSDDIQLNKGWPIKVAGPVSDMNGAQFRKYSDGWGDYGVSGDYLAILRNSSGGQISGLDNMSKATISVWAHYDQNSDVLSDLIDAGYYNVPGSWTLGRTTNSPLGNTKFLISNGSGNLISAVTFPDSTTCGGGHASDNCDTGGWHLYTVTFDGNNFTGYFDGQTFPSNSSSLAQLGIAQSPMNLVSAGSYICIGCMQHQGTPQWDDDQYPNAGYMSGEMADIRIYDTALSVAEISDLYNTTGGDGTVNPPANPTPDTTPPAVSITSPSTGILSNPFSITLTVNATDPVVSGQTTSGVSTVQFKVNGTDIGPSLTSLPYTYTWDASSLTSGAYSLTAVATDGAGNTGTSQTVTITVNSPTTPTDSDQDGVPDTSDLCPNTPSGDPVNTQGCPLPKLSTFTTKPTLTSSNLLAYTSSFSIGNSYGKITYPQGSYILLGQSGSTYVPLNVDQYLHITSGTIALDSANLSQLNHSATLTFYGVPTPSPQILKDGVVCSTCTSVTYDSINHALSFNVTGFSTYSISFTPITDITPPTVINDATPSSLAANTTSATLSVTTDEDATCRYSTIANTDYSSMTNTFSTTGTSTHATTVSGLSNGNTYTYYIRCSDASNNATTTDLALSFSVSNPPIDQCPNIGGQQDTIPLGYTKDSSGNCVTVVSGGSGGGSTSSGGGSTYIPPVTPPVDCPSGFACTPKPTTISNCPSGYICVVNNPTNALPLTINHRPITLWLTLGMSNNQVKTLQQVLNQNGYTVSITGSGSRGQETTYYGPATQKAVQRFQCATLSVCSGTPTTTGYGATGPRTRAVLNALISTAPVGNTTHPTTQTPPPTTPISTISTPLTPFTRILKLGSTGQDVKNLQIFLNNHGFTIATTGTGSPGHETTYFGSATKTALIKFQNTYAKEILTPYGLTQGTGVMGVETAKEINTLLNN